jgi:hypothetical protein
MFMLVLWNQILGQFHKTGKILKDPQKLLVIVQNSMHIYQIAYKKPETILVILNNGQYTKEKLSDIGWKDTRDGLEKYRLTEMHLTLTIFPQQTNFFIPTCL